MKKNIHKGKGGAFIRSEISVRIIPIVLSFFSPVIYAQDYFDPSLLSFGNGDDYKKIDLSQFEKPGYEQPGDYIVDIYVNNQYYRTQKVNFTSSGDKKLVPELSVRDLEGMGVNTRLPSLLNTPADKNIGAIDKIIPSAHASLDFKQLRLNMSIPQAFMRTSVPGAVDPSLWDQGIPAALLGYNLNGTSSRQSGGSNGGNDYDSLFVGLNGGLNAGPWRLRSNATWSQNRQKSDQYDTQDMVMRRKSTSENHFQMQNTYVQRDIQSIQGELTVGDATTGDVASQVFDGFTYRGMSLASNTAMLPAVIRDYAPEISGVAISNAQVTVRQNGGVIYQTNVAPGPFRIKDLSGGSTAGDLLVTITEADGTQRTFRQAYSALPILQRPGQMKYEVVAGKYRQGGGYQDGNSEPDFMLATLIYGLPHGVTLFGGGLGSQDYQSAGFGAGVSLGEWGALSAGITASRTKLPDEDSFITGQSYSLRYAKSLISTGTVVDLAAYRYSTADFYNFQDGNTQGYRWDEGDMPWINERRRSSWDIRLSQSLLKRISMYFSGGQDNYWGSDKVNTRLSSGISGSWNQIGWTLSYNIDRIRGENSNWPENRQFGLSLNLPLSIFGSNAALQNANINYSMTHDSQGRTNNMVGVSGSLLEDRRLNWNLTQNLSNQHDSNSTSAGLNYNGSDAYVSGGYTKNDSNSSIYYGLSGGVVAHPWGVTLSSQPLYGSAVLVRAPGADDVRVMNGNNVRTNRWGYAVVPYASDYTRNTISLDPTTLQPGTDLTDTSKNVYPTAGALVLADYDVRIGQQVLMTLRQGDSPPPFGAIATLVGDKHSTDAGIVGENGQVYLNGLPEDGKLLVKWGNAASMQCTASYHLGTVEKPSKQGGWTPVKQVEAQCQ